MIRRNQRIINVLNLASDAGLISLAYFMALILRFEIMAGGHYSVPLYSMRYVCIAFGYSLALVCAYYIFQMYGSYRFKSPKNEILTFMLINGVGALVMVAMLYAIRLVDVSRLAIVFFWFFSTLLVVCKRVVIRAVLRHYRKLGYNQKHVVVVGNGHLAHQYVQDVKNHPHMGFMVDGYVSKTERPALGKCLGSYEDLDRILEKWDVDELIVALEPHEVCFMKQILETADKEGVHLSIIPFYNDYIPNHPTIENIGRTKLVNMRATPLDNIGWAMMKRLVDMMGALVLIVLSSPVMLAVAIGVKLSSPGPILFAQERVGKDKKPFKMLKFRSMRVTGTENTGWSKDVDPRKTRFGSFIRKFSLDELPQFFNVLVGQMSLVGPRPEMPYFVNRFKEEIPLYLVRQQVRPGITGWAQVNGLRGDTSIEERVKYDIWYIENWSMALDIKILFKTAFGGMINREKIN